MIRPTCSDCIYFNNDSAYLENTYAGLNALSSAWGCVRGDAGLCSRHDVYLFPRGQCADFIPVGKSAPMDPGNHVSAAGGLEGERRSFPKRA